MADATRRVSIRLSLDEGAKVKTEMRQIGESGQRSMEQVRDSAAKAGEGFNALNVAVRSVSFVALAAGIRSVAQAGDALTTSFFRLQNATGSVEAAGAVYDQLLRGAQQTGVAVAESADAFQRFSVAARSIGATNEQVARLVTGLQASAIVSGASTQEIASGTLQLSQGLASGVLQGDELRSILESMPLLAEQLASQLGVGIGQLRKMGSEGRLTADVVFPALLRATDELSKRLENAPLTLSRAFGQLSVSTTNFLGQLDQAIGLSSTLARVLSGAARALDGVRRGAGLSQPGEQLAAQRTQLAGVDNQIALLESGNTPATRRGSLRSGLVGIAGQQAGVEGNARLTELRMQRAQLFEQIDSAERASLLRNLDERATAEQRAADSRRDRAATDLAQLRPQLDARFRINQEFAERTRRLDEIVAAGAPEAAAVEGLRAAAIRDRDTALRALEGTTARAGARTRENNTGQREANDLARDQERLIQANETAAEKYERRLNSLVELVERSNRAGVPLPRQAQLREADAAREEFTRTGTEVREATERTNEVARDLGLTFSSAFEDAVVKGKSLRDVINGIGADLLRIGTRRLVTEPLAAAASGLFNSLTGTGGALSSLFSGGGLIGSLFHDGGMVGAGGKPILAPAGLWSGAQRYHSGGFPGLRPDEVPAILQRGERVLSRNEVRRGGGGSAIVMNITTPDASSFRASQGQILGDMNRAMARGRRGL